MAFDSMCFIVKDCVNLAARLQQTFENDSVHVSDQVFEQAQVQCNL